AGSYPSRPEQVLLGQYLAEKLELTAGSKLVLTLAQVGSGEMNSLLVRVAGLVFTGNPGLDERAVIAPLALVQKALGLPGGIHEIALQLKAKGVEREHLAPLVKPLSGPGLEVVLWQELAPAVASMMELMGFYMALTVAIIFGLVALGIVNTMSMALLERFREFGVLRALGTSPLRLAGLILAEAGSVGLVGAAIGLAVGVSATAFFGIYGINMGSVEAMGVSFRSAIYPHLKFIDAAVMVVVFLALTPLVALGPALKAAKVEPVRALRHE
ncbi:MAG: ABC transporter permease, partial [Deltaproteobacteria bacterium]|nr:ABC transporter permease [Deltaproteobacteria bacterium]